MIKSVTADLTGRARRERRSSRLASSQSVPETRQVRDRIRSAAAALAVGLDRSRPLTEDQLLDAGRRVLQSSATDDRHLAFAMIMVNNVFWLDQYKAVPFERRMLLLPRCLRYIRAEEIGDGPAGPADALPADAPDGDLRALMARARQLGYRTLVADGTPVVVQTLADEGMDAILGVACLDSLEAAFNKVQQVGVPSMAVPLLKGNCRDTLVELDQVGWLLELVEASHGAATRSYLPLLREAARLFEPETLRRLIGAAPGGADPCARLLADAPDLAEDWLRAGGKRLRPFVTLAAYRALVPEGETPDALRRLAVAIEAFHKASLVHDDIEDADAMRYGRPTLHTQVGVPAAINVGDYLIGLGYSLSASAAAAAPRGGAAITRLLADAHLSLARGQGAELAWRRNGAAALSLSDVLRIYSLKTAPAFEAALAAGLVLAGGADDGRRLVARFSRYLGVAFQVLNDLDDWQGDVAHDRPTVLPLLARSGRAWAALAPGGDRIEQARRAYEAEGVFDAARDLVERLRDRATRVADEAGPPALKDLLSFLTEVILRERHPAVRCDTTEG